MLLLKSLLFLLCYHYPSNGLKVSCKEAIQRQSTEMFYKKAVLKDFAMFTGNQLCWSLFIIKLQAFRPTVLLKILQHRCFPVNVTKFLRRAFFQNICKRCFSLSYHIWGRHSFSSSECLLF